MSDRKALLSGSEYFAMLADEEHAAQAAEAAEETAARDALYLGRPGARAVCPMCTSEETRVDEHGGYECEDCGFENGARAANDDRSDGDGADQDSEPPDCYEYMERTLRAPALLDEAEEE